MNTYQDKVKDVLGEEFDKDVHGELNNKALALEKKLDEFIKHNIDDWFARITSINVATEKEKSVLDIVQRLDKYELVVNFNMQLFEILKDKPNLERHGFRASITVTYKLNDLKILYPIARSIQESLRTFQYTNSKVTDKFVKLVALKKNEAQKNLLEGLYIDWKTEYKIKKFGEKIEVSVKSFEDAVYDAIEKSTQIEEYLTEMTTCAIQRDALQNKLTMIQKIVDEFNFNDFSNLSQWVEDLEDRIRTILIKRLEELLSTWTNEFSKFTDIGGKLIPYKTVLEVKIQNQTIVLDPPISEARAYWYKKFHD